MWVHDRREAENFALRAKVSGRAFRDKFEFDPPLR
jgi:hypothetical protein